MNDRPITWFSLSSLPWVGLSLVTPALTLCMSLCLLCSGAAIGQELPEYAKPVELARLENKKVNESSGLAESLLNPGLFWTHNDSGDKARLYCFDRQGKHAGTSKIKKAGAVDWEDMCSFMWQKKPWLLVADTGDNASRRKSCRLYLFNEPKDPKKDAEDVHAIRLTYSTGAMDCEAIGVDVESRKLLLVEKKRWFTCRVFEADMPTTGVADLVAKPIAKINVPLVTACDVSADGRRLIVLTLGQAFEFARGKDETWKEALAREPRTINMPPRKQGEAICYGINGTDLYLTSELTPTPFFLVADKRKSNAGVTAEAGN